MPNWNLPFRFETGDSGLRLVRDPGFHGQGAHQNPDCEPQVSFQSKKSQQAEQRVTDQGEKKAHTHDEG
jgi:hypothetical protein